MNQPYTETEVDELAVRCDEFSIELCGILFHGNAELDGIEVEAWGPSLSECLRLLVKECKQEGF